MPKIRPFYSCIYDCPRQGTFNKSAIVKHEKKCWYNPDNKTCFSCKHEISCRNNQNEYRRSCKLLPNSKISGRLKKVLSMHLNVTEGLWNCEYYEVMQDWIQPNLF